MADMVMTQAQLDAMIASGQASLTPPPAAVENNTPAVIPTQEGMVPLGRMDGQNSEGDMADNSEEEISFTPVKAKEFKFPTLRPRRGTSKMDIAQLKRVGMGVDKIENPEYAQKAREVLNSGARLSDIEKTVKIFAYKDRIERMNRKKKEKAQIEAQQRKNTLFVDKKKTKEKYAKSAGAYKTMGTLLKRLADNYRDDYVGWIDAPYNDAATVYPLPQEKGAGTYKQDYDALFLIEKDAKNMGASFTKSEQGMLRATMPKLEEKEDVYKRKLANYQRTMRDILANKLEASRKSGYKIGELEDAVKTIDEGYQHTLDTFGLRDDPQFKEAAAPSDTPETKRQIRPIGTQDSTPASSMSREEKLKFLKGEL